MATSAKLEDRPEVTIEWPADKVERKPIASLIPYARNARTHTPEQVAQVAASIREWGWTIPVLIDEEGGIIAGHCRVMAAERLKITEIPCMTARNWTEAQKRAYILADNKLALNASWDSEVLAIEISDLIGNGMDGQLVGFSEDELRGMGIGVTGLDSMPSIPDGDRAEFQQMTFTLHDDQAETVRAALEKSKSLGDFGDTGNANSNGNALARIAELFCGSVGGDHDNG